MKNFLIIDQKIEHEFLGYINHIEIQDKEVFEITLEILQYLNNDLYSSLIDRNRREAYRYFLTFIKNLNNLENSKFLKNFTDMIVRILEYTKEEHPSYNLEDIEDIISIVLEDVLYSRNKLEGTLEDILKKNFEVLEIFKSNIDKYFEKNCYK